MKRWFSSVCHAFAGLVLLFSTERNARIELGAAVLILVLGIWLKLSAIEICIVLLCIGGVIAAEAINSAIERMSDFQHPGIHPDIKSIKDLAAAAVLVMSVISFAAGLIIFAPALMEKFGIH
jgi:diacylglycerol kinase